MKYTLAEQAIIWLDSFIGITKDQKLHIIKNVKDPTTILDNISLIENCLGKGISEKEICAIKTSHSLKMHKHICNELDKENIQAICCISDNYPDELFNISDPPLILYAKGNINLLKSKKKFSIVGSRKTLPAIISKAEEFAKELSDNGVTIVTGLAEGVDVSAIKGALSSGNIISIIPGGFKHVYPDFHHSIFDNVSERGLVLSEYAPDVVSKPYFFPSRNRLLAALSDGVLVCSAGKKSGTNYTADFANSYGKNVFAFPYTLGVSSGEGCNAMIKEYAMLCDSVDDIFLSLGIIKKTEKIILLSPQEEIVYNCIKEGEIHIDLLLQKTGMKIFEISPVLTMLEIKKYIVKNPGNIYSAIK